MDTQRLVAAGLIVVEARYDAPGLPTRSAAWKPVVSSLARPAWSVAHEEEDVLGKLERHWRRILRERRMVGVDAVCGVTAEEYEMWIVEAVPAAVG